MLGVCRSEPLERGAPNFRRCRASERAAWPVVRAGTASSRAGWLRPGPTLTGYFNDGVGAGA
eukprot:10978055-Alexandrium_andersonii.AAC.1